MKDFEQLLKSALETRDKGEDKVSETLMVVYRYEMKAVIKLLKEVHNQAVRGCAESAEVAWIKVGSRQTQSVTYKVSKQSILKNIIE